MRILTGGEYSGQPTGEGVPVALAQSGSQPKKNRSQGFEDDPRHSDGRRCATLNAIASSRYRRNDVKTM